MWGPSQFLTPLYPQFTLRIYATTNELDGVAQTDFVPGREKPLVHHWLWLTIFVSFDYSWDVDHDSAANK